MARLRLTFAAAKPGASIAAPIAGNGIGLAPDGPAAGGRLAAGGVCSLRTAVTGAAVSAMVAVAETRIETLWSAA